MAYALTETPVMIQDAGCRLFGVMRSTPTCRRLLVLIPALTGTRIGPQNIYVDIARSLAAEGTACLCLEFPQAGDSYDETELQLGGSEAEQIHGWYERYLRITHHYLKQNYSYKDIFLGSISVGCMPALRYAQANQLAGAILLSPNHLSENPPALNKKNLRTYAYKLIDLKTWKKFFLLKINYRKVYNNIIKRKPASGAAKTSEAPRITAAARTICIFGEKDSRLQEWMSFWRSFEASQKPGSFSTSVVAGADHSFFGWGFKQQVCNTISQWLNAA